MPQDRDGLPYFLFSLVTIRLRRRLPCRKGSCWTTDALFPFHRGLGGSVHWFGPFTRCVNGFFSLLRTLNISLSASADGPSGVSQSRFFARRSSHFRANCAGSLVLYRQICPCSGSFQSIRGSMSLGWHLQGAIGQPNPAQTENQIVAPPWI